MRILLSLFLVIGMGLLTLQRTPAGQDNRAAVPSDTKAQIRRLVDTYIQSIVNADTKLGATVWSTTPDVSFIEPRGSEKGWDQIAEVFYGKTMGEMFTKRTLKVVGDPNIQVYGTAAVVEFNWDFVAILRSNGQTIHTTGRETQVYADLPGVGWRLVHVHYSGPPVGGPNQG